MSDHTVALLKNLLSELLQPLLTGSSGGFSKNNYAYRKDLEVYVNQLIEDAVNFNSTNSGIIGDASFFASFADALLAYPDNDAGELIERIEQLGRTVGPQLLQLKELSDQDRLKIGRKLSHNLMLLRMKLAQRNIMTQSAFAATPPRPDQGVRAAPHDFSSNKFNQNHR
ncbi:MAG TPA: hypothetical protein VH186_05010 [Chloroflexia bacterium]|nr:hypothetical protein [Chloroflexia bacterium]